MMAVLWNVALLMIAEVIPPGMAISICQNACCNIPEGSHLHTGAVRISDFTDFL
jgi:hypothetical protein